MREGAKEGRMRDEGKDGEERDGIIRSYSPQ